MFCGGVIVRARENFCAAMFGECMGNFCSEVISLVNPKLLRTN